MPTQCLHNGDMNRTTNPTAKHFVLTRNGETVATDKVGAHSGVAAWARMMDRLSTAAGVDRLRCTDATGRNFAGGFTLEGPFEVLR